MDTLIDRAFEIARFSQALDLAIDPTGEIYVVDAGRDVVVRLNPDGSSESVLGGPGTETGQFDAPADIDPTNGLILLIADTGNGRIQRFSREYLPLGTIVLDVTDDLSGSQQTASYNRDAGRQAVERTGRPVAIVSPTQNQIFIVDETSRSVMWWDDQGRLIKRFGDYRDGSGSLVEPVALVSDGHSRLFVADRGRAEVLVYDLYGGFVRVLAHHLATDVQSLSMYDQAVIVILPNRLLVYDETGKLARTIGVDIGSPLVDAVRTNGRVYLLTKTALFWAPI